MEKRIIIVVLASVVIGVAITRITGFDQTPMVPMAVDVVYWCIPLPWTMTVIPT